MKGIQIALDVRVASVSRLQIPPNCDVLVRTFVGDVMYGLVREPNNRGLYLLSPSGAFHLDTQQLVATFADAVREWDHDRGFTTDRGNVTTSEAIHEIVNRRPNEKTDRPKPKPARARPRRVVSKVA